MAGLLERLLSIVNRLPAGVFAFVMATGIVSTAMNLIGQGFISDLLLILAVTGLVVLSIALFVKLLRFPRLVIKDFADPDSTFGFFTLVAALNVVGVRTYSISPMLTLILGTISLPIWLILNYGIAASLFLGKHDHPVSSKFDGSWFLWVVGTQSLATASAAVAQESHLNVLASIAVAFWGIGVILYITLASLIVLHLFRMKSEPSRIGPSYWIFMGATAITVLAGSRILVLPKGVPILEESESFISGLTLTLWAFGLWWVPMLLIFGVWRHGINRWPTSFEGGFWSIVFPLGMFAVASMHFGLEIHLPIVVLLGEVFAIVSVMVWLLVVVLLIGNVFNVPRRPRRRQIFHGST